ncbi:MAG: hypothetical protein WCJ24_02585 [Candidatus Saccharibacteria bacterium]
MVQTQTKRVTYVPHRRLRILLASLLAIISVSLILSSLVIIWLNRTLTDTDTYVKTVAPLATKPEIQNFIAQKASEAIITNVPIDEIATALLPAKLNNQKTANQFTSLLQPIVYANVLKVIQLPTFAQLWETTNHTAHVALLRQLSTDSPSLTLDLNPVITGVIAQLKTTPLAPITEQIEIKPNNTQIYLAGSGIQKAHFFYKDFQRATWAIVAVTLICITLAIIISVNRLKTILRLLFGTGILTLLLAFSIWVSSYINIGNSTDLTTKNAAVVIAQTLLHNLQIVSLVIGAVCITIALGLKFYITTRKNS